MAAIKHGTLASGGGERLSSDQQSSDTCPELSVRPRPNDSGVAMALLADRDSRLLIDGKLVAGSGGTFTTLNPATEEVLGTAADADADDMGRAIEAARRAFDDTDWSRDVELRVRCLRQLRQRDAGSHRGAARTDHRRGRRPADADLGRRSSRARSTICASAPTPPSRYAWNTDLGYASAAGHARPTAPSPARPSASSARSRRGTSRTRSTSPRSARRWRPATPWCSSPRRTPRGARPCWAS